MKDFLSKKRKLDRGAGLDCKSKVEVKEGLYGIGKSLLNGD